MYKLNHNASGTPGGGVDAEGRAVVDPTANVLALVEAANRRQDDLRVAEARRSDDLREAEARRLDEQATIRAGHEKELREAEAKRIDAIRAVDVNAVAVASERAAEQANVLATQLAASADALRTLVASTATTVATSQDRLATSLTDRLTTREQAGAEGKGRSAFTDPAMAELTAELRRITSAQTSSAGKSEGMNTTVAVIVVVVTLLISVASVIVSINRSASADSSTPRVVPNGYQLVPVPSPKQP